MHVPPPQQHFEQKSLPRLHGASASLYERDINIGGVARRQTDLLIYGGVDEHDNLSGRLIRIDLGHGVEPASGPGTVLWHEVALDWSEDAVPQMPVARWGAGSAVVNHQLFLFGGWTLPDLESEEESEEGEEETEVGKEQNVDMFSVIDLDLDLGGVSKWSRNEALPGDVMENVGSLGYDLTVVVPKVYDDNEIMLMSGKQPNKEVGGVDMFSSPFSA